MDHRAEPLGLRSLSSLCILPLLNKTPASHQKEINKRSLSRNAAPATARELDAADRLCTPPGALPSQ